MLNDVPTALEKAPELVPVPLGWEGVVAGFVVVLRVVVGSGLVVEGFAVVVPVALR